MSNHCPPFHRKYTTPPAPQRNRSSGDPGKRRKRKNPQPAAETKTQAGPSTTHFLTSTLHTSPTKTRPLAHSPLTTHHRSSPPLPPSSKPPQAPTLTHSPHEEPQRSNQIRSDRSKLYHHQHHLLEEKARGRKLRSNKLTIQSAQTGTANNPPIPAQYRTSQLETNALAALLL